MMKSLIRKMWSVQSLTIAVSFFLLVVVLGCTIASDTKENNDVSNGDDTASETETFYENDLFFEVFQKLLKNHYSATTEDFLWHAAMMGMIASLNDPFTQYFDAERYDNFRQNYQESFVGIGVSVENYNEQPLIRTVWPGSPAERAGIFPGDTIVSVDGVTYPTFFETLTALLNEEGTGVTIEVKRPGMANFLSFTMIREIIANPSVEGELLENKLGYLTIRSFGTQTASIVADWLVTFEEEEIEGLIIDLRNNGGGSLSTLNALLNLFLIQSTEGLPFYTLEIYDNGEWTTHEFFGNPGTSKSYEIVVLINGYSASASEVFAAAMNEIGGYALIGEKTYGKGTLQSSLPLAYRSGDYLHISIGKWLTPTGQWVHNNGGTGGVLPTIECTQNPYFFVAPLTLDEGEFYQFDQVSTIVERAQIILNAIGYDIRVDGYFDSLTETALLDFQTNNGLEVSGRIDEHTAHELSQAIYAYRLIREHDDQFMEALNYLLGLNQN